MNKNQSHRNRKVEPPRPHAPLTPSTLRLINEPDPRLALTPEQQAEEDSNFQRNYFNSNFANLDTICNGFGERSQSQVPHQIIDNNRMGSLGMTDNGCINIRLPCVYSYEYDPIPKKSHHKKKKKPHHHHNNKNQEQCQMQPYNLRLKYSDNCDPPPFCSTVGGGFSGAPCKGYVAKCMPECGGSSVNRNKTQMKWDYQAGERIPVKGVDYGEELYETAARNLAKQMNIERSLEKEKRSQSRSSANSLKGEKCTDFAVPSYNSSLKTSNDLAKALEGLKNLPVEIERIFKSDKRFEPIILDRASKVLNTNRNSKVFKDLVPVEPNESVKEQLSKVISEQVQSVKPPTRSRDPEPSLLDFQEVSFSRMKPKPVPSPPKPQSGVSVDLSHDNHIIESERKFEEDADKMD